MTEKVISELRVVFDKSPGPESPRFIECENADGKSVLAGEWRSRSDGLWELVITQLPMVDRRTEDERDLDMERYSGR